MSGVTASRRSATRVVYRDRAYVIDLTLDAEEAENIAFALGLDDQGAQELFNAACRARDLNAVQP